MTTMLNVKDLRAYYGQVQALHGLSFSLNQGSLTNSGLLTSNVLNSGFLLNSGAIIGNVANSGTVTNNGLIQGAIANNGTFCSVINPGYDQLTKDYAAWQANAVKRAYKPLFTGMNFSAPSDAAKGTTSLESVITDVRLGRKTISDFQNALSTWQNVSGNELRSFFEGIAKKYGTGA